jgi:chromosome segregation ATPase
MRSKYVPALLMLSFCCAVEAQQPINLSEDSLKIGSSVLPAFSVTIPECDYATVLKSWTRELESGTKSKVHSDNSEMQIMGAQLKDISKNAINVYSKIERLDSMLILYASFETRKDEYVTSKSGDPDYIKVIDFLKEFAKDEYADLAKSQSDAEEKKLRELERELSSLEREKSRMEKSIESNKSDIISEKDNISLMNNELRSVEASLSGLDSLVTSIGEGSASKEKDDQIKDLERRKRKALNSVESSERKITKSNDDIEKATRDIPQNERMQEMVRIQIAQQQAVCQRFEEKLKTIKSY